jgi:hypothetical protein
MGTKSSVHVRTVTLGSEAHNQRTKILTYVKTELTPDNESFVLSSISDTRADIQNRYKKSTGQKMQDKANPIREGVLLISKEHTIEDLKRLSFEIEKSFGIRTIQAYTHKDEGHEDVITKEWKPNFHAHMIFDWTNKESGKTIKMSREDMSELQTIVANSLKLERGTKSTKKHITSTRFKSAKEEQDFERVYNVKNLLPKAISLIESSKSTQNDIKSLQEAKNTLISDISTLERSLFEEKMKLDREKEEYRLKSLEDRKNIEIETELTRANLDYLKDKVEVQRAELNKEQDRRERIPVKLYESDVEGVKNALKGLNQPEKNFYLEESKDNRSYNIYEKNEAFRDKYDFLAGTVDKRTGQFSISARYHHKGKLSEIKEMLKSDAPELFEKIEKFEIQKTNEDANKNMSKGFSR